MFSDIIIALRQLRRTPIQTVIAILTLGLGIGLATTMGSLLKALVLDPFNYPDSDRIVQIWNRRGWPLSPADFKDQREQSTSFESFGAYTRASCNVGGQAPATLSAVRCTSEVLRILGIQPSRGRLLTESDELTGAAAVAVISDAAWHRLFAGDPEVIGRHVPINGVDTEIVGVMPAGFEFRVAWFNNPGGEAPGIWTPLSFGENLARGNHWLMGIARLKDGVSVRTADAECKTIAARLSEMYPQTNSEKSCGVVSLRQVFMLDSNAENINWLMFGAGVFLLLLACANVACMLIAQGTARQREFSVRLALGASRWSILRLVMSESLLLAFGGVLFGLLASWWGTGALAHLAPLPSGREAAVQVDTMLLFFAFALAVVSTALVGLPTAFATRDSAAADVLRGGNRGQAGTSGRQRLLRMLIIGQVAVALLLANTAMLFASSYRNLRQANPIMSTDQVLAASFTMTGKRYANGESRWRFLEQLVERVKGLPGVVEAGVTNKLPLRGGMNGNMYVGKPGELRDLGWVEMSNATRGYFPAAGISLLKGRLFAPDNSDLEQMYVVVNRTLAELAWPGEDPLGKIIYQSRDIDTPESAQRNAWTVIGMVEDTRQQGAGVAVMGEIYVQYELGSPTGAYLVIRSSQDARPLSQLLKREVAALDPDQPIGRMETLKGVLDGATQFPRFQMTIMSVFTICAIVLTMVGIYGTLSYYVQERTREIGIRMALGASRNSVIALVLRRVSLWLVIGLILGSGAIFGLGRLLRALLYEVQPVHPPVLIVSAMLVLLTGLLAGLTPALRATRVEPLEALRTE